MYQNIFLDIRKMKMHLWDDQKGHLEVPFRKYAYVKHSNGQHVSLYGDRLKKVTSFDKDDPTLHESDVPPTTRFLVDNYGDSDEMSVGHRIMFFDIEVEVTDGFPDVKRHKTLSHQSHYMIVLQKSISLIVLTLKKELKVIQKMMKS